MTVLSSSRATPLRACPARGPRWCPLHSPSRLQDSCLPAQSNRRLSSAHAELSLTHHNYKIFGAQSRGLHARYTWLHTHPCGICMQVHYRFGGSPPPMGLARSPALTHWVTSTDFTRSFPIPRFRAYLDAKLLFLGSFIGIESFIRQGRGDAEKVPLKAGDWPNDSGFDDYLVSKSLRLCVSARKIPSDPTDWCRDFRSATPARLRPGPTGPDGRCRSRYRNRHRNGEEIG